MSRMCPARCLSHHSRCQTLHNTGCCLAINGPLAQRWRAAPVGNEPLQSAARRVSPHDRWNLKPSGRQTMTLLQRLNPGNSQSCSEPVVQWISPSKFFYLASEQNLTGFLDTDVVSCSSCCSSSGGCCCCCCCWCCCCCGGGVTIHSFRNGHLSSMSWQMCSGVARWYLRGCKNKHFWTQCIMIRLRAWDVSWVPDVASRIQ